MAPAVSSFNTADSEYIRAHSFSGIYLYFRYYISENQYFTFSKISYISFLEVGALKPHFDKFLAKIAYLNPQFGKLN